MALSSRRQMLALLALLLASAWQCAARSPGQGQNKPDGASAPTPAAAGGNSGGTKAAAGGKLPMLDIVLNLFREDTNAGGQIDTMLREILNTPLEHWNNATVADLKPEVWLYVKAEDRLDGIQQQLPYVQHVVPVQNIGRESHPYLTHMLARRGSFADFTLFMQPDGYNGVLLRMRKLWIPETGAMGLAWVRHTSCEHGGDWGGTMVGVRDVFNVLSDTPCHLVPNRVITEFERALMLVSRRRLMALDTRIVADLHALLANNTHAAVFNDIDYLNNETRTNMRANNYPHISDPFFGHVMERSWAALVNCWHPSVSIECRCNNDQEPCVPGSCGCLDDLETGEMLNAAGKAPPPPPIKQL